MAGLYSRSIAANVIGSDAQQLVLLHGWGMSSVVWQPIIDALSDRYQLHLIDLPGFGQSPEADYTDLEGLLDSLVAVMPARFTLLGFSLGGMLAVELARRYPARVERVLTVASNARFVAADQWPEAMSADNYQAFYTSVASSPSIALKRFLALQAKGSDNEKALLQQLKQQADKSLPSQHTLLGALSLLVKLDLGVSLLELKRPVFSLLGSADQLVPLTVKPKLQALGVQVSVAEGAAHLPFVSHPEIFITWLESCMANKAKLPERHSVRDKQAVAQSFSKAAASYDTVAELQRNVGRELLKYVPVQSSQWLMDLGCGTGYFLAELAKKSGAETLLAFDLAEGMLRYARQQRSASNYQWLCGDAESLPLADNSVDMIFSSLAIQWCENSDRLFVEVERVLKPGGQFVFATLGPETLIELRKAWQTVDDYVHVNRFEEQSTLHRAFTGAGLACRNWQEQIITLQYEKLTELTRELKALGAHNVNPGRPEGLMGKQRLKVFRAAYEAQRDQQQLLPATYQVWYAVLEKPQLGVM